MPDINQSGPDEGSVVAAHNPINYDNSAQTLTYADLSELTNTLLTVLYNANTFMVELEADLATYSLPVTKEDPQLVEAVSIAWPSALGVPKDYISYYFYQYLENINTRAANYIRAKYETAAKDVTGTSSIDIIPLVRIIQDEAILIQGFITNYVNQLDDSAEQRSVEHLQDWTKSAILHAGNLRSIFQKTDQARSLPSTDLKQVTPSDARKAQALFKVNLNRLNHDLSYLIDFIRKEFWEYSSTFYNNILGPALTFRLNVSRKAIVPLPGTIGREISAATSSLDANLKTMLADQIRRNILFEDKYNEFETVIIMRDQYRTYIKQLSQLGQSLPHGAPGVLSHLPLDPNDVNYFSQQTFTSPLWAATPSFASSHGALDNLLDPGAHPQYVLKAGDTLTGNLALAPGVLIDGMRPSLHAHTGRDGTTQIHGSDILDATLGPGSVDPGQSPGPPFDLTVQNQTLRIVPPGITVVDVTIAWESPDGNTWEVQYSPIA